MNEQKQGRRLNLANDSQAPTLKIRVLKVVCENVALTEKRDQNPNAAFPNLVYQQITSRVD